MLTSAELYGAARGKWYGILAKVLGKENLTGDHGPCPICGGVDRFRWDDKDGEGGYYCSGCGPGRGMTLIMKSQNIDYAAAAKWVEEILCLEQKPKMKPVDPRVRLKRIMADVVKTVPGDPVAEYLTGRGLSEIPPALQTHPGLTYWEEGKPAGVFPAMVSMFRAPDGTAVTIQVQYVKDGAKAPVGISRKTLPGVGKTIGGAVRLWPAEDFLVVAEGVETAVAAYERIQLPAWATLSADSMAKFVWPEGLREIIIVGDNDMNFVGQVAAYTLARRVMVKGNLSVRVYFPKISGEDYLDEWVRLKNAD